MKSFLLFLADFFKDQKGTSSSKRAVLYWSMCLLTYMIVKGTQNMEMFWGLVGLILAFGGYATSEFFKKKPILKNGIEEPEDPLKPD